MSVFLIAVTAVVMIQSESSHDAKNHYSTTDVVAAVLLGSPDTGADARCESVLPVMCKECAAAGGCAPAGAPGPRVCPGVPGNMKCPMGYPELGESIQDTAVAAKRRRRRRRKRTRRRRCVTAW